jgi:hypothetical protein
MTTAATEQPQHMAALEYGNNVRLMRADWKRSIRALDRKNGYLMVAGVLEAKTIPWFLQTMTLDTALMAVTRQQRKMAARILTRSMTYRRTGMTTLGELTLRERSNLAAELRRKAE